MRILYLSLFVLAFWSCQTNKKSAKISSIGFEELSSGDLTNKINNGIEFIAHNGELHVYTKKGKTTPQSLHIPGGESKSVEIVNRTKNKASYLIFYAERWTSRSPFSFRVETLENDQWTEVYNGDKEVGVGNFPKQVLIPLPDSKDQRVRVLVTSPDNSGALLDDVTFYSNSEMEVDSVAVVPTVFPILTRKENSPIANFKIFCDGFSSPKTIEKVTIKSKTTNIENLFSSFMIAHSQSSDYVKEPTYFASNKELANEITLNGTHSLSHGVNNFYLVGNVKPEADIHSEVSIEIVSVTVDGKTYSLAENNSTKNHLGIALRQHNDEGVHTFRIPGLATTNKGTLIGVYDVRRDGGVDLQGDIDVGMNRSTDCGKTWEPMKIIIDMGEWGGRPENENGIGDPSILVDRTNNTIWVAGIWAHGHPGQRNWWASRPGMSPEKTSQFILVKSEDDGKTWSKPINITQQIKDKDWYLLLQGPGKGITMKNGTIVFPAQFKDKNNMPHSTIIWSDDKGENWNIGTGAKSNTTESQVIELNDGTLMLNMRDNRNQSANSKENGRAIAVTSDMGKTWTTHKTSNHILKEPTCMASLIKENFVVNGQEKTIVLFSNPNSVKGRHHLTIKASFDDGETWNQNNSLLIDSGTGRGYSCMTKVDDTHIGILYEGSQSDLIYQVFSIDQIIN